MDFPQEEVILDCNRFDPIAYISIHRHPRDGDLSLVGESFAKQTPAENLSPLNKPLIN